MTRVLSVVACVIAATNLFGATITGRVTSVADGDSFVVVDGQRRSHRVRIQAIDAPERAQAFSSASRASLREMLSGRDVVVVPQKTDQYGRIVANVFVAGRNVGLEQLRSGMAWFYTHYGNELGANDRAAYLEAQRRAKAERRGLWSDSRSVPPWQFRRR